MSPGTPPVEGGLLGSPPAVGVPPLSMDGMSLLSSPVPSSLLVGLGGLPGTLSPSPAVGFDGVLLAPLFDGPLSLGLLLVLPTFEAPPTAECPASAERDELAWAELPLDAEAGPPEVAACEAAWLTECVAECEGPPSER